MDNLLYYVFCIVALIVAFIFVKKVAGCLIKSIVMAAVIAVLLFIYFMYFK
ncbi:MAG: hypothetical protein K5854_09105 [Prevotella sp.]|nr:hypothetical protein [Prevotella sp.]